ncbi:D-aminoacylase [Pimelobacter simplex]|uniref:D-aminoacylase n=1 Tax=Nocardioides simplex TaxID=2045 RepID=A0A7J5E3S4_NOCSI|nr:D-aminoacylase [Pimelobacter simplex]KAB2812930.1 D-aminoacylase [Pimelobacter simplex]
MTSTRTLIRHALLVDGTGAPPRPADVLLDGATIAAVTAPGAVTTSIATEVDATGLVLTPGFIDVHSHADNAPFLADDDTSKVAQGVTTEVVGNCGFSLAPCLPAHAEDLASMSARVFPPIPWAWRTFADYLAATDAAGYVTNTAPLVGHNALRLAVLGFAGRPAAGAEVAAMGDLLDEALAAGAFGLSSGLAYPPGIFSGSDELAALARHLPVDRPYVSHVRSEGALLTDALDEALAVGRGSGRAVHVSHLKVAGRRQWGSMPRVLDLLDRARAEGLDVRQDVYPYTASSTMLTATLPPWMHEGGRDAALARLRDPAALERLRTDIANDDRSWENPVLGAGWEGVVIAAAPRLPEVEGCSLAAIAEARGLDPFAALVAVLREVELEASMVVHSMHEDDLDAVLRHPATMIGSDGLPPGGGGKPHPRMYGTFPRVLARYARDRRVLDLSAAVRRMTSLPAAAFGLHDRGVVAPGYAADLVALRLDDLADRATYDDPTRQPDGIAWVRVNGDLRVAEGRYLPGRSGRRLTPR